MIGWTFCSGIGAPELSAPDIDWRLASEIEPFPRAVLQQRFNYKVPENHNQGDPLLWGDMTEVTPALARKHGVPLPDFVVAGTPCQAFSVAGARKGTADERGNLTLKFVETCHAIVAARPDGNLTVLWENVPGVLSDNRNAFGCFLGGLIGADGPIVPAPPCARGSSNEHWRWCKRRRWRHRGRRKYRKGYHRPKWPSEGMVEGPRARIAWRLLDAQYFGVAQRRRRVFAVISFGNGADPAAVLFERQGLQGNTPPSREPEQDATAGAGDGASHWSRGPYPTLTRIGNGIGASNQELFAQNEAGLVPSRQMPASVAPTPNAAFGDKMGLDDQHALNGAGLFVPDVAKTVTANGQGALDPELEQLIAFDCKGTQVQFDASGVSPPLRSMNGLNGNTSGGGHAAVAFDLRGRDGGAQVESIGETVSLRAEDGGSSRSYVALGGDITHSLTGEGHDASEDGSGRGTPIVAAVDYPQVRRLTPTECARLQGGPDDHTAIEYRGKPAGDGPQYKAWGNSMAVPCVGWIIRRIQKSIKMEERNA